MNVSTKKYLDRLVKKIKQDDTEYYKHNDHSYFYIICYPSRRKYVLYLRNSKKYSEEYNYYTEFDNEVSTFYTKTTLEDFNLWKNTPN